LVLVALVTLLFLPVSKEELHRLVLLFTLMAVAVAALLAAQIVAAAVVAEHFPLAQTVLVEAQLLLLVDYQTMQLQYQFKTVDLVVAAEQAQAQAATLLMVAVVETAGIPFTAAAAATVEHPFLVVLAAGLLEMEPRQLAAAAARKHNLHPVQVLVVNYVFGGSSNVTFCNN
jgi:hypothetical protein